MHRLSALLLFTLAFLFAPSARAQDRIKVGAYVNQVSALDLKGNQFTVDFWLWFVCKGCTTSAVDSFDVVGARINSKTSIIRKTLPSGEEYASVRVNATIHSQWDLKRYPLDDHDLEIRIEDSELDETKRIFLTDAENQGTDPELGVAGWEIAGFSAGVLPHRYLSNYGDTSIAKNAESRFSRYAFVIHAKRSGLARFLKVTFPLLVSVIVAWCAFFVRPKDASPRVAISVGALFATAAATVAMNSQLPEINYVTLADKVVFSSLGMISISLLATVVSLSLHYRNREKDHHKIDRIGAIVFPILYVTLLVAVVR